MRALSAILLAARWRSLPRLVLALCAIAVFPSAAMADEELAEEPLIPGVDSVTDFEVAPGGDVFVARQDGAVLRYRPAAGSTAAHPRYSLAGELVYQFSVTRQNDRGLVGITLDHDFDGSHPYLYALITRGSVPWVDNRPGGNPNGIRRTAQLVRVRVPTSGPAAPSDLQVILGKDAPADPDSTCKPFTAGQAPASDPDGEGLPNGVQMVAPPGDPGGAKLADFSEAHIYPDGDLSTTDDAAYDCLPSDADTHGLGEVISAPDGSLFISVGDATPWNQTTGAALRTYNLESPAGKVLHVDRDGRGFTGSPFCPTQTDTTHTCTKVWAMGLRNAFRMVPLPADSESRGQPVLAAGNVGNYTLETLDLIHPGDNVGWPCWEGSYWNYFFADPSPSATGIRSAWGGPGFLPPGPQSTSCMNVAPLAGEVAPPSISPPIIEYAHDQGTGNTGAAIVAGPRLSSLASADPAVALPASWEGSLLFGDYVRGWIMRLSADTADPGNSDRDGGLLLPRDELRAPQVYTEAIAGHQVDPMLDQIASRPALLPDGSPPWYRLTMRQGPQGTLWTAHIGEASQGGGLTRFRAAPAAAAAIESVTGACVTSGQQGPVTITAGAAGSGAIYEWDVDGDGLADPQYVDAGDPSGRTITLSASQLTAALAAPGAGWIRLFVRSGGDESVAARYLCKGPTPVLTIAEPGDQAEVVLGQPVVVRASRPDGDATRSGIPDSALRWVATTVHGNSHEHPLAQRDGGTEQVGGSPRLQFTITPTTDHELGSSTRVRLSAPSADAGGAVVRLVPKPVAVQLASEPAGAELTLARDVGATAAVAPATVTMAAGYRTTLSAPPTLQVAGETWAFDGWSDGAAQRSRDWQVPATGGAAPTARYVAPAPTTPTTPTTPATTPPSTTPTTPTTPVGPPRPLLSAEVFRAAPLTGTVRGRGRRTAIGVGLALPAGTDSTSVQLKVAVRDARCRWWNFTRRRFAGRGAKAGAACVTPAAWRQVPLTWAAAGLSAEVPLGAGLPAGRYVLRLRLTRSSQVIGERAVAVRVASKAR